MKKKFLYKTKKPNKYSYNCFKNHLLRAVDNLTTISTATQKAKDQVEGANFASETSKLASNQILQQASTSMVTQASNIQSTFYRL